MKLNTRVLIQLGAYALLATCVMGCSKPAAPVPAPATTSVAAPVAVPAVPAPPPPPVVPPSGRFPAEIAGTWLYKEDATVSVVITAHSIIYGSDILRPNTVTCDDPSNCTFVGANSGTSGMAYCMGELAVAQGELTIAAQGNEDANEANKAAGRPAATQITCSNFSGTYVRSPGGASPAPAAEGNGDSNADGSCMSRCAAAQGACVLRCGGRQSCIVECGATSMTCVGECS